VILIASLALEHQNARAGPRHDGRQRAARDATANNDEVRFRHVLSFSPARNSIDLVAPSH